MYRELPKLLVVTNSHRDGGIPAPFAGLFPDLPQYIQLISCQGYFVKDPRIANSLPGLKLHHAVPKYLEKAYVLNICPYKTKSGGLESSI